MAMGKRKRELQERLWVEADRLADGPSHPFYRTLNDVLDGEGFDDFVEEVCQRYYAERMGRPSLPPAVYFRLLLIGYFEGIDSERGIAWRVADSLSLRRFLGYAVDEATPDHSVISRTRRRLALEAHQEVFGWILALLARRELVSGKSLGLDATTLEANAALRSIVRRDTGESYREFLEQLAKASGIETPTRQDLNRIDRNRPGKGSNRDWKHPGDPDARITKMKDGRTHLAHKAEHVVDVETGAVLAATLQAADRGDPASLETSLPEAMDALGGLLEDPEASKNLSDQALAELVADKGYHSNDVLTPRWRHGIRTYIAEPKRGRRRWKGKREAQKATYANRRRIRGNRGKALWRLHRERTERSFAHCYDSGALRRTHLRGHENIRKRQLVHVGAFNLGILLRKILGAGTPRGLAALWARFAASLAALLAACRRFTRLWSLSRALPTWIASMRYA